MEREEEEEEETKARKGRRGGEDVTSVSLSWCAQLGTILLVVARSATLGAGFYCNIFRFGMVTTYPTTRGVTPCCRRDCFNMPCPATWGPSLLWPLQLRKQALCSVKRQAKQAEVQPTPSPPRLLVGLGLESSARPRSTPSMPTPRDPLCASRAPRALPT